MLFFYFCIYLLRSYVKELVIIKFIIIMRKNLNIFDEFDNSPCILLYR